MEDLEFLNYEVELQYWVTQNDSILRITNNPKSSMEILPLSY